MAALAWGLHRVVPAAIHLAVAGLPLLARLAAALVAGEFGFYWGHRWTHEIPFLWGFALHPSQRRANRLASQHPWAPGQHRVCPLLRIRSAVRAGAGPTPSGNSHRRGAHAGLADRHHVGLRHPRQLAGAWARWSGCLPPQFSPLAPHQKGPHQQELRLHAASAGLAVRFGLHAHL